MWIKFYTHKVHKKYCWHVREKGLRLLRENG